MTDPTTELNQEIAAYRKATIERRARAFIDCPDHVMGIEVLPITPRTWTMLTASGSRFMLGGQPMEGDIRNYLWFHSRLFKVPRWVASASWLKWFALLRFNVMLHRQKDVNWYCATVALAGSSIAGILDEAMADAAKGGAGSPGPCLEAQLIHVCAKEYGWSPERTRETPLRYMFQYVRCMNPDDDDSGEQRVRFAHLEKWNAILQQQKAEKEKA